MWISTAAAYLVIDTPFIVHTRFWFQIIHLWLAVIIVMGSTKVPNRSKTTKLSVAAGCFVALAVGFEWTARFNLIL